LHGTYQLHSTNHTYIHTSKHQSHKQTTLTPIIWTQTSKHISSIIHLLTIYYSSNTYIMELVQTYKHPRRTIDIQPITIIHIYHVYYSSIITSHYNHIRYITIHTTETAYIIILDRHTKHHLLIVYYQYKQHKPN
jgi:ABC-type arginine transport system permease subunit